MTHHLFTSSLHLAATHLASVLGFLLALLLLARLAAERRPVPSAWAWLLALVLIPYLGVPLYLALGGRKLRRRAEAKAKLYVPGGAPAGSSPVERVLAAAGAPPRRAGHEVELLGDGQLAFRRTIEMLESARASIHLSTFILAGDATGAAVVDVLERKARAGVEVKLLIDALFAWRADRAQLARLREAGGEVEFFMPLLLRRPFHGHANLRNHRKIASVDGAVAITGGMNLADEYMGTAARTDRWRDVGVRVRGPAVADIERVFLQDWAFARGIPPVEPPPPAPADGPAEVQVVASGPDTPADTLYDGLISGLFEARTRAMLATPYFIPDDGLMRALLLAVRRGVTVTLVVPARSNHALADWAGRSYLRQLAAAGVRVRLYEAGMLHAKMLLVDDDVAVIGSANLDMRSLFLDYELSLLCHSAPDVERVHTWFRETLARCADELPPRTRAGALVENVARLLGPLL